MIDVGERQLFEACLDLPTERRDDFVSLAGGDDSVLKTRVRRLLSVHHGMAAKEDELDGSAAADPKSIGPYRVLRRLGQGGMGTVYLAEQRVPLHRRVAIKVVRRGLSTEEVMIRFEMERRALALMTHPGIARIIDAGTTDTGGPYFVMEYVPGEPITSFCDRRQLSVDARLKLFLQVCEAVEHAHQRGVIHRDLKPSNILVTADHGRPAPRIIDFGLVKAIGEDSDAALEESPSDAEWRTAGPISDSKSFKTRAGRILGTPEFMSPEQALGPSADVDTRTDVYALGMVLYQLLVGSLPFQQDQTPFQILEDSRTGRLPRPSLRLQQLGAAEREAVGTARSTRASRLSALLRRDLDWVVAKALSRSRDDRYPSAGELACDVRRYRQRRPVLARRPGVRYRLQKFVARNSFGAAAAATVLVSATAYGAALLDRERSVRRALEEAMVEAERANEVTSGVLGFFNAGMEGDSVLTRMMVERGHLEIERLAAHPARQAHMLHLIGRAHVVLGSYVEARSMFERAVALHDSLYGPEHLNGVESMISLADVARRLGDLDKAEELFHRALAIERSSLGPTHPRITRTLTELHLVLRQKGNLDGAEQMIREVLDIRRLTAGSRPDEGVAQSINYLAAVLRRQGRYAESAALYAAALKMRRDLLGDRDHLLIAESLNNLGVQSLQTGDLEKADSLSTAAVAMFRRLLGNEHPHVATASAVLAELRVKQGRSDEAVPILEEVLRLRTEALGPSHPLVARTERLMSMALADLSRWAESDHHIATAIRILRPSTTRRDRRWLAQALHQQGVQALASARPTLAEIPLREAAALRAELLGPDDPDTVASLARLAEAVDARRRRGSEPQDEATS